MLVLSYQIILWYGLFFEYLSLFKFLDLHL